MSLLPIECLASIVHHVDQDGGGLYALLTVNKTFFHLAAERLYRDPFRQGSPQSQGLLAGLVLALSTSQDERVRLARQAYYYQTPRMRAPIRFHQPPTIDYLSLVRVIRWASPPLLNVADEFAGLQSIANEAQATRQEDLGYVASWSSLENALLLDQQMFVHGALTWAILDHRSSNVQEIEVDVDEVERYTAAAAKLQTITTIVFSTKRRGGGGERVLGSTVTGTGDNPSRQQHPLAPETRLIQAIQAYGRGHERLWTCKTRRLWHRRVSQDPEETALPHVLRLLRLLPVPRKVSCVPVITMDSGGGIDRSHGSTAQQCMWLDHPLDGDLADIVEMDAYQEHSLWRLLRPHYPPGFTVAQLFQRCRGLQVMNLTLDSEVAPDLLAWAAHEANQFYSHHVSSTQQQQHQKQHQKQAWLDLDHQGHEADAHLHHHYHRHQHEQRRCSRAPPMAIKVLSIRVLRPGKPRGNLEIWNDGLHGFAGTLEKVYLTLEGPLPEHVAYWQLRALPSPSPLLPFGRPLAKLRLLHLVCAKGMHIEAGFWEQVPALEVLHVTMQELGSSSCSCSSNHHQIFDHDNHHRNDHSPREEHVGDDPPYAMLSWPVVRLPSLTCLRLEGQAVWLFHPASLRHLPKLKSLALVNVEPDVESDCYHHDNNTTTMNNNSNSNEGALRGRGWVRDLWTWEWTLPQLKELFISGHLETVGVHVGIVLQACPQLQSLHLEQLYQPILWQRRRQASRAQALLGVFPLQITCPRRRRSGSGSGSGGGGRELNHGNGLDMMYGSRFQEEQEEEEEQEEQEEQDDEKGVAWINANVTTVMLRGPWLFERAQVRQLFWALPRLKHLELGGVGEQAGAGRRGESVYGQGCTAEEMVRCSTRGHRWIEWLEAPGLVVEEEEERQRLAEMGLCPCAEWPRVRTGQDADEPPTVADGAAGDASTAAATAAPIVHFRFDAARHRNYAWTRVVPRL